MILLVEDEKLLQTVIAHLLEERGYEVVAAETVAGAQRAMIQYRHRIRLAVVDMLLPDGDGWQVCAYLREHAPQAAVILSSGCPFDELPSEAVAWCKTLHLLEKPYSLDALMEIVACKLGSPSVQRG